MSGHPSASSRQFRVARGRSARVKSAIAAYSSPARKAAKLLVRRFRRGRRNEFLEARIVPKRIEIRIEPEQRRSKRHIKAAGWCRKYFLQSSDGVVGLSRARGHAGENLNRTGTRHGIFLDRIRRDGSLSQNQGGSFVTKTHIGKREISNAGKIFRVFFEKRF